MDLILAAVVLVALFFDFTNGFHDAANAVATSISTRALSPRVAVVMAGIFNFAGAFVSLKVAATVATGIVVAKSLTLTVILAGVIGALVWNLVTWRLGLPSSSSHALIGGVAGAAISAAGFGVIQWQGLKNKVLLPSLASPILGFALAALITLIIIALVRRRSGTRAPKVFRKLQIVTSGFVAFTHGTNDAQKTMGVIALALLVSHPGTKFHVPMWVIITAAASMALGTYVGGWRIITTLGKRITHLEPHQGFAAEASTAVLLGATGAIGFPVSTTHTITGSVLGSGVAESHRSVKWSVVQSVLIAWALTLPAAALVGAGIERLTRLSGGTAAAVVCVALCAFLAFASRGSLHRMDMSDSSDEDVRAITGGPVATHAGVA